MKIEVWVSNGLVGCTRKWVIEIEDGCEETEIDDIVNDAIHERIEWGWKREGNHP